MRINPNAIVGDILVEPLTRKGFPDINELIQTGTNKIVSQTSRFDAPMLVAPGESYDVALKQPGSGLL